jgi:hypothetical protein
MKKAGIASGDCSFISNFPERFKRITGVVSEA